MPELAGRVGLVTGASSGIGREVALTLARHGCRVVLNHRQSEAEARQVADEITALGGQALVVGGDVADEQQARALITSSLQEWDRLDYLVNNAATTARVAVTQLDELELHDWDRIMAVNLRGAFQVARAAAPALRACRGAVVNVSSTAAFTSVGSSIPYSASKAALNNLTLSLARALAPEVRVNAVAPGMVETPWLLRTWGDRLPALRRRVVRQTPLGHLARADEVAQAVLGLLLLPSVTGQILVVDGGYHLRD